MPLRVKILIDNFLGNFNDTGTRIRFNMHSNNTSFFDKKSKTKVRSNRRAGNNNNIHISSSYVDVMDIKEIQPNQL